MRKYLCFQFLFLCITMTLTGCGGGGNDSAIDVPDDPVPQTGLVGRLVDNKNEIDSAKIVVKEYGVSNPKSYLASVADDFSFHTDIPAGTYYLIIDCVICIGPDTYAFRHKTVSGVVYTPPFTDIGTIEL